MFCVGASVKSFLMKHAVMWWTFISTISMCTYPLKRLTPHAKEAVAQNNLHHTKFGSAVKLFACFLGHLVSHESGVQVPWSVRLLWSPHMLEGHAPISQGGQHPEGKIRRCHRSASETCGLSQAVGTQEFPLQALCHSRLGLHDGQPRFLQWGSTRRNLWHFRTSVQPDFPCLGWMRTTVLWEGLPHSPSRGDWEVQLYVSLVLLSQVQAMSAASGGAPLQVGAEE